MYVCIQRVIGRKSRHFIPHLYLAPQQEWPRRNFAKMFDTHKSKMIGVACGEEIVAICWAVSIQYRNVKDRPKTYINVARQHWRAIKTFRLIEELLPTSGINCRSILTDGHISWRHGPHLLVLYVTLWYSCFRAVVTFIMVMAYP